eukprot:COSAG01_NODE_13878_length_1524_cov_1.350175_1_plen_257_part_00
MSQLTAAETTEWLKGVPDEIDPTITMFDRWLLPKLELNVGTAFDGRPVGNHAEHMPWDSSLNKDVDDCVGLHVDLTDRIKKGADGKWPAEKFLCSTPRLQDAAYLRVLDPTLGPTAGAPLGHRIVGDFGRCYGRYLTATCLAKGWAIDEHKAAGHRWRPGGQHGGKRVKKAAVPDDWVHPDAQAGIKMMKDAAVAASLSTPPISPNISISILEKCERERAVERERIIAHERVVLHFQALARLGSLPLQPQSVPVVA